MVPAGGLPAWLEGDWSIDRAVNGRLGAFRGQALFIKDDAGGLIWQETGRLCLGDFSGEARRSLAILPERSGWTVVFEDGRPFHALDLRTNRCSVKHFCGSDVYRGSFTVTGTDGFTSRWVKSGPDGTETIQSAYKRVR
jgi:hypothetical protein